MEPFNTLSALVAPLDRNNIDTDAIIPKQFLKKIERTGFGKHLFHDWRFLDDAGTQKNPEFTLNMPKYKGANILLTRDNFGCGSSREHAPWALFDYGFKAIIASSFADIFYNNCFKNGILPIVLAKDKVETLFKAVENGENVQFDIDLETQNLTNGNDIYTFEVDAFRKHSLQNGIDDIGWTLGFSDKITSFESRYSSSNPWMFIK